MQMKAVSLRKVEWKDFEDTRIWIGEDESIVGIYETQPGASVLGSWGGQLPGRQTYVVIARSL